MTEHRTCARDGCDEPMDGRRNKALYHSNACRTAAYRSRRLEAAQDARVTSHRRNPRPSDIRISYDKAVRRVATGLAGPPLHVPASLARSLAETWMRDALTVRQREVVEGREP